MASDAASRVPALAFTRHWSESLPGRGIALTIGGVAVAAAIAVLAPWVFLLSLAGLGAGTLGLLAFRHNAVACALWLLVVGSCPEMWLGDLLGPASYQPIIAVVKTAGLVLAGLAVLRFGPRADPFNPSFAFVAMFLGGWAHGLHPGLTPAASLRSLAGSAAPFAFSFSRLSAGWARAIIGVTAWIPLCNVAAGGVLAIAGIRPLFMDSGGASLSALGIGAFLAMLTLTSIYACLIELYRQGGRRHALLLACNYLILVLTGERAALLWGSAVVGLTLAFIPSPVLPRHRRLMTLLAAAAVIPILVVLADTLSGLRLFNVLAHEAGNLSGRDRLWPLFEGAAADSPWFGWGVGAGNTIVPQASKIVSLMHTWAAHNEYLRIGVEGGQLGQALLIGLFVLWCIGHGRHLARPERGIIRLVLLAFACHAVTDNVLIATPALVLFAFIAAVFARGRLEAEAARRQGVA